MNLPALKGIVLWLRSLLPPHVVSRKGCITFNRPLTMREIEDLSRKGKL